MTEPTTLYRRRRKRARVSVDGKARKFPAHRQSIPILEDDSALAFLSDNDNDDKQQKDQVVQNLSLPILLEERRMGAWKGRQQRWKDRAVSRLEKINTNGKSRRQWRPYSLRSIPFTLLGTPTSDAVLALERNGSYVLTLRGQDNDDSSSCIALALRFYGVPSPAATAARTSFIDRDSSTPVLQTTPLLRDIGYDESDEEAIFQFRRGVSPANTPVQLLISSDWKIGMAFIRPTSTWNEDGPVGTLILFSLPTCQADVNCLRTYQCANVSIGAESAFTFRNLSWRVHRVPYSTEAQTSEQSSLQVKENLFQRFLDIPGYLMLNDEEDGFRLTWIIENEWSRKLDGHKNHFAESPLFSRSACGNQSIITTQNTWEVCYSEKYSGSQICGQEASLGPHITCEGFLHVEILLDAILERRKSFSPRHPDYYYNLISITHGGRVADLVITFMTKQRPAFLGVFIRIDLFTAAFEEQDWVKSRCRHDTTSLRNWCNSLAVNRRMRQLHAGPYSIATKHSIDWGRLCTESFFDYDEQDDYTPSIWKPYLDNVRSVLSKKPPKQISLSSLYPDCDLVTNKAVTKKLPVSYIKCKTAPIELIYG